MRRASRFDGRVAVQVGMIVLAVLCVIVSIWFVTRDEPDAPAEAVAESPAPEASPSPDETPWAWPTVHQEPEPVDLVPGDGTFVDPASVDRSDPDAVAEAAATIAVSHDTALDGSRTDAQRRMGWLATGSVLDGLGDTQGSGLGADWLAVAPYDAYTTPTVELVPRHEDIGAHEGHDHAPGEHQDLNAAGEPVTGYIFDVTYQWAGREQIPADVQPEAQTRQVMLSLAEREEGWQVVDPPYIQSPVG